IHKFLSLPHGLIRASRNIAEFFCASWQLRSNARSTHRPPQSKLTVRTWRDQQRSCFAAHAWKIRANVQKFNKARTSCGPTKGLIDRPVTYFLDRLRALRRTEVAART